MTNPITLPEEFRLSCNSALAQLLERTRGAYGAILATIDGHAVLNASRKQLPEDRIAAMTSSLIALGETIAKEAQQQKCRYVIVENSDGYVVTLRIAAKLILSTFGDKEANLGMLLSASRIAAETIAKAIPQRPNQQ